MVVVRRGRVVECVCVMCVRGNLFLHFAINCKCSFANCNAEKNMVAEQLLIFGKDSNEEVTFV